MHNFAFRGALTSALALILALTLAPFAAMPGRAEPPASKDAPVAAASASDSPDHEPLKEPLSRFPRARVLVDTGGRSHAFDAWIADTPARREQGLMWIRDLPADRGMLFVFERPQPAAFWMKNTYVSLDLLFVAPNGTIIRVAERAEPQSLAPISSIGTVLGVLEVRAGTAARLGIRAGHRVRHPAFAP